MSKSGKKWEKVGIGVFRGIHSVNLDDKGRLAVPARFRSQLEAMGDLRLIITLDTQSPCLLLYPYGEWEVIEQKLQALPSFNETTRRIQRLLIGHATELELDGHGRILLPTLIRDHAKLNKRVTLLGQGKKFELWDDQVWQTHRDQWLQESTATDAIPAELENISL